jgi:eukaryotic-like serine/threonine-protein kinase
VGTGIDGSPRLGAVTPLEPGDPRTIGRYGLTGRLGTGGMGTVYLGRALGGGPPVAVKVVHAELAGDPEFRARFADEVAAARRVAPFCTARVVDADPDARAPYLVTEFVDGVPLNVAVSDGGPLDESTLHGVALGVAAALSAVHAAGVVHRDLKPANVLLSLSGPRVIDFGIARALDVARRHTQAGMLVGTPGWMAPEQFRAGTVGPAADVFSWGSLVAYAATGHNPWSHAQSGPSLSPTEQAHRILYGTPELGTLTGPLRRLVESALAKDPARRPTARQLVDALLGGPRGADPTRAAATALQQTWAAPTRPSGDRRRPGAAPPPTGRPRATSGPPWATASAGPSARARWSASARPSAAGPTRALPAQRPPATRVMPPTPAPTPPPTAKPQTEPPTAKPAEERPRKRRRRWWTRKRVLVPLGLLVAVVLLANRDDTTRPPASGSQLGMPVRDGNVQFVVSSVRCGVPEVGSGLVKRTASGQFCLADVRATNVKRDARTLYEPFQKLVDSAGRTHSADITMRVVFRDQTIWDKIQPGEQVRGTMVFDIPKNVSATALELHDGIASGGVTVRVR